MPGFDGTGPRGQGPLTGRGRGYCAIPQGGGVDQPAAFPRKTDAPPYLPRLGRYPGRGLGLGRGRGRGAGRGSRGGQRRW